MSPFNLFQRVSQVPTNSRTDPAPKAFGVADLYKGPVQTGKPSTAVSPDRY